MVDIVTALNRHINHGNDNDEYPLEVILNLTGKVFLYGKPFPSSVLASLLALPQRRLGCCLPLVFTSCARMQGCW